MKRKKTPAKPAPAKKRPAPAPQSLTLLLASQPFSLFLIFLCATLVYYLFAPLDQPSRSDLANWDYFAQVIARGGVPYKDVVNIKSPLSAYLGAAAIVIGNWFGVTDVLAIRLAFIVLAALTVAFTYIVALDYFQNRRVAWLSAAILLASGAFGRLNTGGVQPKTPMILFGLIALWAIIKDRPFAAGLFAMLSALSWQPGFLFAGAAGLAFSRYFTSWRDGKVLKLTCGAVVPLALVLLYFLAAGALKDAYLWNVHFNATVYAPREMRTLGNFLEHFSRLVKRVYGDILWFFYLAAAGLIATLVLAVRRSRKQGQWLEDAPKHAIIISPVVYLVFCRINIQGGPDLIPLLPFVAIFAAVTLIYALEWIIGLVAPKQPQSRQQLFANLAAGIVTSVIAYQSIGNVRLLTIEFPTLADQQQAITAITSRLKPQDKIFVYGGTEVLVLSGLTNLSKYFLLDKGKDLYLDQVEPGGFTGWLERLKAEQPRVVVLDRMDRTNYLNLLLVWTASEYEYHSDKVFSYYVRKEENPPK